MTTSTEHWDAPAILAQLECDDATFRDRKLVRVLRTLLAPMLARDADVRTLDDWAASVGCSPFQTHPSRDPNHAEQWVCWTIADIYPDFYGSTPDEARAKAAAWVRSQK